LVKPPQRLISINITSGQALEKIGGWLLPPVRVKPSGKQKASAAPVGTVAPAA
jgi:hypothetical protein